MVEGHTDDVPVIPGNCIKDNWDLSVMRATEVVRILTQDGKLDPKRVIASGRSEYAPVATGDTPDARRKNRRTDIIITPNLNLLYKIIKTQ